MALWDIHRHRLAPAAHRRLEGLLAAGHVEHVAARITALQPVDGGVAVTLRHRDSGRIERRIACAAVNCTGPNLDIGSIASPLLQQLQADGLVRCDLTGLGLEVDGRYRVVGRGGRAIPGLYYLGPMLKSRFWEAIAVPELRGHAQSLAAVIDADVTRPLPQAA